MYLQKHYGLLSPIKQEETDFSYEKGSYVEYCEEDEKSINDEGANVGECCESKCHFVKSESKLE